MNNIDDYWNEENINKRQIKSNYLKNIENKIFELQKEYNKIIDDDNGEIEYYQNKYIIYTFIGYIPYGWEKEGSTHIGTIAELFEENPQWLSSSERCS